MKNGLEAGSHLYETFLIKHFVPILLIGLASLSSKRGGCIHLVLNMGLDSLMEKGMETGTFVLNNQ
jgi:hypothetical protein